MREPSYKNTVAQYTENAGEMLNEGRESRRASHGARYSIHQGRGDIERRTTLSALAPRMHARILTLALLDTLGPPRTNSAIPSARAHDSHVHATHEAAGSISRTACGNIIPASRSYLQIQLQRQARISTKCIDVSRQPFSIRTRRPRCTREQGGPTATLITQRLSRKFMTTALQRTVIPMPGDIGKSENDVIDRVKPRLRSYGQSRMDLMALAN